MSQPVPDVLRDLVRERAQGRCEYCLIHEDDVFMPHEPDHIIASKHRGQDHQENLAWSCFVCNRHKGSDIASIDIETGQIVRLFNPRTDDWAAHFLLDGARITPTSPEGRVTEYVLQLNREDRVRSRKVLIRAGNYPR